MHRDVTLVTGATGFAGSHLVRCLDPRGTVVGWHRPDGQPPNDDRRLSWQAVDLTDRASVVDAIAALRPSRIFHVAGAPNVATSWSSAVSHLAVNALGTHHVLDAVRVTGEPCRVLVVSSGQIYRSSDDPIDEDAPLAPSNPYGLSKLAQDQDHAGGQHDQAQRVGHPALEHVAGDEQHVWRGARGGRDPAIVPDLEAVRQDQPGIPRDAKQLNPNEVLRTSPSP